MHKIPTLFRRDPDQPALITREVHPDCQWVLDGEGTPTRKLDGTCMGYFPAVRGEVRLGGIGSHEVSEAGDLTAVWLARREVKPGKTQPPGFVVVSHDEVTGKTVGWEPVEQSSFAKVHAEALDLGEVLDEWPTREPSLGGTYELIGPKVNGNPEKLNKHILVRHGYIAAVERDPLDALPRDFDGLIEWLLADCDWEGVVWHHPDGRRAKLKVRDALAYVKAQDTAVALDDLTHNALLQLGWVPPETDARHREELRTAMRCEYDDWQRLTELAGDLRRDVDLEYGS